MATTVRAVPRGRAAHVLAYHLVGYRRTWRATVFSSFLLPVIYLAGIGLGVGGYVDRGHHLGVAYLSFLAPGVLATTALTIGVEESTYRVFSQFEWDRTYEAMLATPLRVVDLLLGQLAFVVFRALVAVVVFLAVMAAFGTVHSPWAVAVVPVGGLIALACAAPTFAFTATQSSAQGFSVLQRFAVIPVQLFSGVFFPVSQLPAPVRPLAYLSPLWHGVELCRGLTLGTLHPWPALGHLAYLAVWAGVGFALAARTFRRRLVV
ncbi:ABC transporter permease [Actinocatenispora rupis]|uniref:Transport permease protein n=1 Tax=Actinocatenispora rupis TaxID=519421 RepID=A0A8J3IZ42_9ACTN|nr:ABC transporter permease [Actinocatenispora rupis]GID11475.1 transport permease protein [Actinocatenispora rupis]